MRFDSLPQFLTQAAALLARGPVAVILCEDDIAAVASVTHHLGAGFRCVLVLAHADLALDLPDNPALHRIDHDVYSEAALTTALTTLQAASPPGTWFFGCYNAEFLFHPFCEARNVRELLAFHTEERRGAMLTYVIDLYAGDLAQAPDAVDLDNSYLDRAGYFALARLNPDHHYHPRERQLDFFGGLRWRFEEHVPPSRRRIDRISLFRAREGLAIRPDFTTSDEEYNTYACPWHHNMTAAVCSFRTAKALRTNPGSRHVVTDFLWHNSVRFDWSSQQLMDLGLMEPGQWF